MRLSISPAVLLSLVILTPRLAGAQKDDPRKVQAAPIFDEGMKLGEKGQNSESLEKFRKAYGIYPSPNTLCNIARQEQLLGRRLQALRDFREALRNTLIHPGAAEQARANVAELERVLARVKVVGPDGTRVDVGGVEYTLPLAEPVDVEPGNVTVHGAHGGETLTASTEARVGQVATLTLAPRSPATTSPTVEPPAAGGETSPGVARWVVPGAVLVVGVVGVGVGVGFSAKSQSTKSGFDDRRCETVAGAECASLRESVASEKTTAIVGYVAGGALIAGAAILWALWPQTAAASPRGSRWVVPQVGVGHAGVALGGNF